MGLSAVVWSLEREIGAELNENEEEDEERDEDEDDDERLLYLFSEFKYLFRLNALWWC